jgi:hypothetical protein
MRQLIELTDSINSKDIAKILPGHAETGRALLEIAGIGSQEISLISTRSNLQGFIKWAICPACKRRVRKLYLPLGADIFLCRRCYNLGYRAQYSREYRKTPYERKGLIIETEKRKMSREEKLRELIKYFNSKKG